MKEVINIYKKNKVTIDNFISSFVATLPDNIVESSDEILSKYKFVQLVYLVDCNFKQVSPVVCRTDKDIKGLHTDKSHYFTKLSLNDKGIYTSNPYIHYRTGKASISLVVFRNNQYSIIDISLVKLLESLKLIEYNSFHDKMKRGIYTLGSAFLAVISLILILFGGFKFFSIVSSSNDLNFLHDIFKSIISITLGLAIFDLAKQIFEHEVLFTSFDHPEEKQYKVLGKFLISIVIALSIETLMVVFKIALDDVTQMLPAFYLMIGTTLMFIGLGFFYKTINSSGCSDSSKS
jgi:hypothetical protein